MILVSCDTIVFKWTVLPYSLEETWHETKYKKTQNVIVLTSNPPIYFLLSFKNNSTVEEHPFKKLPDEKKKLRNECWASEHKPQIRSDTWGVSRGVSSKWQLPLLSGENYRGASAGAENDTSHAKPPPLEFYADMKIFGRSGKKNMYQKMIRIE